MGTRLHAGAPMGPRRKEKGSGRGEDLEAGAGAVSVHEQGRGGFPEQDTWRLRAQTRCSILPWAVPAGLTWLGWQRACRRREREGRAGPTLRCKPLVLEPVCPSGGTGHRGTHGSAPELDRKALVCDLQI